MDERSGTVRLVEPAQDSEAHGLAATVSRTDVEQAMRSEGSVDLLLDVERVTSDGHGRETQRIALGWEPQDLEQLLKTTDGENSSACWTKTWKHTGCGERLPCSQSRREWPRPEPDRRWRRQSPTAPWPAGRRPRQPR
jgi:hypothetical protein